MGRYTPPRPEAVPDPETEHGKYDAHFLRAYLKTDPFTCPWHMRPKMDTDLTLADFREHTRLRIEAACKKDPKMQSLDFRRLKRILDHIAYVTLYESMQLHIGRLQKEKVISRIRYDLRRVYFRRQIVCNSLAHPLWDKGDQTETTTGIPIRICSPNTKERPLVLELAKPINIEGPEGKMGALLEEAAPHLLELDDGEMVSYFPKLRQDLKEILEKEGFNEDSRHKCVDVIIDVWHDDLPPNAQEIMDAIFYNKSEKQIDLVNADPEEILRTYLAQGDQCSEEFDRLRVILEQLSLKLAYDDGDKKYKSNPEHVDAVIDAWNFFTLKYQNPLCDYPFSGLANLALAARRATREQFEFLL